MGVFSLNNNIESPMLENVNLEDVYYTPDLAGAYMIVAESEHNYNMLMKHIGIEELSYYEENGTEMVYESGAVSGFFSKAKEYFLAILEKVKQLFRRFFSMFDGYIKDDKAFVDKYKKHVLVADTKDFKYKGFKFTNLDSFSISKMKENGHSKIKTVLTSLTSIASDAKSENEKFSEKDDFVEELRGAMMPGSTGSLTANEFSKELFEYFRDGNGSKETIETVDVSKELLHISSNSDLKKKAERAYRDLEKTIRDEIKFITDLEKSALKEKETKAEGIRYCNNVVKSMKNVQSILQVANGAYLNAIKSQNRQSKAICSALLTRSPHGATKIKIGESGFLSGLEFK